MQEDFFPDQFQLHKGGLSHEFSLFDNPHVYLYKTQSHLIVNDARCRVRPQTQLCLDLDLSSTGICLLFDFV